MAFQILLFHVEGLCASYYCSLRGAAGCHYATCFDYFVSWVLFVTWPNM